MRRFIWIPIALALLPAAASAQALPDNPEPAPSGATNWTRVQGLANGEAISVARAGEPSVPCRFAGATNDSLYCDSFYTQRQYRFDRAEVDRIRSDDKRRNLTILVGTFTAAGFILGVATPPGPNNGTPRVVIGLEGAALGALAGAVVAVPAAFLIPGRLVYRHSSQSRKTHSTAPATENSPTQPRFAEPAS